MADMEVKVGAEVSGAIAGLNQLQSKLDQTGKAAIGFDDDIQKAASKLKQLPSITNQATFTLNNFTRVVQDAPYGIRGIANNIDPLVESFVLLRNQTGSTTGAIQGMIEALTGPAGILLAVSTVTSILVQFSDQLFSSSKQLSNAEVASITYLASLENVTEALSDLRKELDFEADLAKLNNELSGLSGYALDIANAQSEIGKNNEYIADLDDKITPLKKKFNDGTSEAKTFVAETNKFKEIPAERFGAGAQDYILAKRRELDVLFQTFLETGKINDELLKNLSKTDKIRFTELAASNTQLKELENERTEFLRKNQLLEKQILLDRLKAQKEFKFDLSIFRISKLTIEEGRQADLFAKGNIVTKQYEDLIKKGFKDLKPIKVKVKIAPELETIQEDFQELQLQNEKFIKSFEDRINEVIKNIQIEGFAAIGTAIGNALAGGDVKNAFTAFGEVIASGLQTIGKYLIEFGILAKAVKVSLAELFRNPLLAIATGVGLIAAGAALKTALNAGVQARALGGPVSGGTPYLVGERGPELFVPSVSGGIVPNNSVGSFMGGKGSGGGTSSVLRGQDILLAYARTQRSQLRVNG
jgi:hypothetical protein